MDVKQRALGKKPHVSDPRIMRLSSVLPTGFVGKSYNWRAHMPQKGIPMLRNDIIGCCVFATILHYVQLATAYVSNVDIDPTDEECIAPYSAVTGYDPAQTQPDGSNPTDNGTVVAGPGGALEYWHKNGIVVAGENNKLLNAVKVDFRNIDHVKNALSLGPLMVGAQLTQENVDSDFMWSTGGDLIGGHEFLVVDCETISTGKIYFDVETWDGMRRFDDAFLLNNVDEIYMVLDPAFFGPSGLDPADLDIAAVQSSMLALAA